MKKRTKPPDVLTALLRAIRARYEDAGDKTGAGRNGTYVIRGWILGRDGKQDSFWKDPAGGRPAFFVPQSSLITDFRGRTS